MQKKSQYLGKKMYTTVINTINIVLMLFFFQDLWFEIFNGLMDRRFNERGNILMIFLYGIVIGLLFKAWGAFKVGYDRAMNVMLAQFFAIICSNVFLWLQVVLLIAKMHEVKNITLCIIILTCKDIALCIPVTLVASWIYPKLFKPWKMLQINGENAPDIAAKIQTRGDKYEVCKQIIVPSELDDMWEELSTYDAVLLNEIPTEKMDKILRYCFVNSIRTYFTPRVSDIIIKGTDAINLFDSPLYLCKNVGLSYGEAFVKRCFDIAVAIIGLIITSPILLLTAIAIKLEDKGPVMYLQERCTLGGKVFNIYKFRSMIIDAERDGEVKPAIENDERITKIGKIIRRLHIDELPQLVNVLKGEMSIVGPRPERIEHVLEYSKEVPEFYYRLKVKGGITGFAQVYGKYNTTAYDKLKMDLQYIVDYSFLLDIQIIFETFKVLFKKDSTEGFKSES